MSLNIAISGGTGYVGKKLLLAHLKQGDNVRVLSRSKRVDTENCKYIQCDLSSPKVTDEFFQDVDIFYHCAGVIEDEKSQQLVNVHGTAYLIAKASKSNLKRWVQLSSIGVYGSFTCGEVDESFPENALSGYELTKLKADQLLVKNSNCFNFQYVILRPSNIYSFDMKNQSLFQLFKAIKSKYFFYIGSSNTTVNYVHVDDVIQALMICGVHSSAAGKIFNLSNNCLQKKFIETIAYALKVPAPKIRIPKFFALIISLLTYVHPGFPLSRSRINALSSTTIYSNNLICTFLGFTPKISVEAGMLEMAKIWISKESQT